MSASARWKVHGVFLVFTAVMCLFAAERRSVGKPDAHEYFLVGGVARPVACTVPLEAPMAVTEPDFTVEVGGVKVFVHANASGDARQTRL